MGGLDRLGGSWALIGRAEILDRFAVGVSERWVARELESLMIESGGDGLAFDPIVAFGENAAEPHHEPNHRTLEEGDVLKLDLGALVEGYHSDMTRTVCIWRGRSGREGSSVAT